MTKFCLLTFFLNFFISGNAQVKMKNVNLPYLAIGTSVSKPFGEINFEVGSVREWKEKFTIRPSIGLNRTATGGLVYRTANITYGAGYQYEIYDNSIDHVTRGIASIEVGYPINDKIEVFGGYGLGFLISTEGITYAQQGYDAQPIADFLFTSTTQNFEASFTNDYTGLRRGQHFISLGGEYAINDWLRIGLRSRIGLLDQSSDEIYTDGFVPLNSHGFNLIFDF